MPITPVSTQPPTKAPARAPVDATAADGDTVLGRLARVATVRGERIELRDGRVVGTAVSCLLAPLPGDRVLVTDAPALVLAVLERAPGQDAVLHVAGAAEVRLRQDAIAIETQRRLRLCSARDAELNAVTGTLSLGAREMHTTVLGALIESAAERIARFASVSTTVRGLFRLHTRHGIVTADKQIRMDAEQIHMG